MSSARRWGGAVRDLLLYGGAAFGLAVVGWLVYAQVSGSSLISVQTGSMSPTIPTGSLIVSRMVDVGQVKVGDVVTARLDDASPLITHRVVRIQRDRDGIALVLKGDANDTEDLFPYRVRSVLKEQRSIKGGAYVLDSVRSPLGASLTAITVGGLVGWALWPSKPRAAHRGKRRVR